MNKFYVVMSGCAGDYNVVSVCRSKTRAEEICSMCECDSYIEECIDGDDINLNCPVYNVTISINESTSNIISISVQEEVGETKIDVLSGNSFRLNEVNAYGGYISRYVVYVQVPDAEEAICIAKEHIFKYRKDNSNKT